MIDEASLERARAAAEAAVAKLAQNVVALDVSEAVSFADIFVIATGRSDRQVRAIADAIDSELSKRGARPQGMEGYDEGRWVLIDLGDVIVHVFSGEARAEYDLERLWSDAPPLELGVEMEGALRVV